MNDTTKKVMTLEDVRDWMRRLEKQHDLIPPLREAYGSAADAIDAHLSAQCNSSLIDVYDRLEKVEMDKEAAQRDGEAVGEYLANVDEYGGIRWIGAKPPHGTKLYTAPPTPRMEATPEAKADLLACDWQEGALFWVNDEPGEHDPCYLVMPCGGMLAFNHHAVNGVDQARAKFIADCCNQVLNPIQQPRAEVTDEMVDRAMTAYDEFLGMDDEADYEAMRSAIQAAINGNAFFDSNIEERMLEDAKNACHHCGGSGHKDDAKPRADPYAYIYEYDTYAGVHREFSPREWNGLKPVRTVPVYTAQPSPLVELTKELVDAAIEIACRFKNDEIESVDDLDAPMRAALEAALSEKGHD